MAKAKKNAKEQDQDASDEGATGYEATLADGVTVERVTPNPDGSFTGKNGEAHFFSPHRVRDLATGKTLHELEAERHRRPEPPDER